MFDTRISNRFVSLLIIVGLSAAQAVGQQSQQRQEQPQSATQAQSTTPAARPAEEDNADEITAVPNRPTLATTGETVQRGVLEVEYGFEGGRGHQNINGLLKFGIFKNLEIRFLNNSFERDGGVAATGDSGAGFKWRVFPQQGRWPTVSLLYTAYLPTAGNGLGIGAAGHQVLLLVSKDFGKQHFDVNEGIDYLGRVGASGDDRNYFSALSWSTNLSKKWGVTAEVAGYSWANTSSPATLTLLAAPTYSVKPWMVIDFGAYYAVYGNYPRWTCFTGLTYSIADLYHGRMSHRPARK